jgi:hypothetical protein
MPTFHRNLLWILDVIKKNNERMLNVLVITVVIGLGEGIVVVKEELLLIRLDSPGEVGMAGRAKFVTLPQATNTKLNQVIRMELLQ